MNKELFLALLEEEGFSKEYSESLWEFTEKWFEEKEHLLPFSLKEIRSESVRAAARHLLKLNLAKEQRGKE